MSDREKILDFYRRGLEDNRFQSSRFSGMEPHYTKRMMTEYIAPDARVIEIGCATGYYAMHFADHCAHYTGVDLTPEQIDLFREKIAREGKPNITAAMGDATDLREFADAQFDVVMCLGPMYHLPREERAKVFSECARLAKPGGIVAFAYISCLGVYAGACALNSEVYPNPQANHYLFNLRTDDLKPGVFHYTSPEEMALDAAAHGLCTLKNRGVDFFFAMSAIDAMSDETFECFREIADRLNDSESCTGMANHALLVCKKTD